MHSMRNNFRRMQNTFTIKKILSFIYPSADLSRCKPIFSQRKKRRKYEKAEGNCVLEKSVDYTWYASRYRGLSVSGNL